ncbi:MAG TPA: maltose alpha-D-glucosyltransferase [Candidatus Acidoferrum sp.]|nr:maltose alpha-D-glucosyltransferase [Candidatus Acidoferrum sp.]
MATREREALGSDPLWYKDAIIYQLHVRSFCDSNADGIGDFVGLTSKLDYLQDLGVTAIWVMPFYPSPLKDDGYDIADYYQINPIYGTLDEFQGFLAEAHRRGLRVITELVINHTSDQNAWFQKSRRAMARLATKAPTHPDDLYRDFYVWTQDPTRYKEVRIIFKDFEPSNWTWDPIAQAYYWHRFFSHQPDLNFDNPRVHEEILRAIDYWCDIGVDGFRLDAIPYLYEREGTSGESLPETHAFLKMLRAHVDEKYGDRIFLAEANQWPEESVTYFGQGKGDECHMAFHFPVMPRLFMSVRMEDRVPLVDIIEQTPPLPETAQWAIFLRNHDELTLEMVTDEERDYMYRVYANDAKARINLGIRRRLAPLLGNDRNKIELLNLLLLALPGTPVIYYGDEIGMGDNIYLGDRNGVRTPMHWSSDKNAGFSRSSPQALQLPIIVDPEYHYEAVNVETQERNTNSLLWWMKRAIALRKKWKAFGRGALEFLQPTNRKVLAFVRRYEDEAILVAANLSRFPQPVELDLAQFKGMRPRELFGRTKFPPIGEASYPLTLSPHAAFWFRLEPIAVAGLTIPSELPTIRVATDWREALTAAHPQFEAALPQFLQQQRWFAGQGKDIESLTVREAVPVPHGDDAVLAIIAVNFVGSDVEHYCIPLALVSGDAAELQPTLAHRMIARVSGGANGFLIDASVQQDFASGLVESIRRRATLSGKGGRFAVENTAVIDEMRDLPALPQLSTSHDYSNTTVMFGDKLFLKLFRRLEAGENPELELTRFLSNKKFPNVPELAGALEYRRDGLVTTLAMLSRAIPEARSAWNAALDALGRYFDRVRSMAPETSLPSPPPATLLSVGTTELNEEVAALLGTHGEMTRLLGQRTAEFHLALAAEGDNPEFRPDPFTPFYQRSLFQSIRNRVVEVLNTLRERGNTLPDSARALIGDTGAWQKTLLTRLRAVHSEAMEAQRIRVHGDYHLGQVLYTGKDFYIIDLEGDWSRPLSERRIKRSPFRDVAEMVRSFHYVARVALQHERERGHFEAQHAGRAEDAVRFWSRWISAVFLRGYLAAASDSNLLPRNPAHLQVLFDALLIDRTLIELGNELNNRPESVHIPLRGLIDLIEPGP